MKLVGERVLLRIYLRNADRAPHTPTHQRIIRHARNEGLAGTTVLKGIMGCGSRGLLKPSMWSLTEHVPIIVEIVDTAERIGQFIHGTLDRLMIHGMLTLERASVMLYRHGPESPAQPLRMGPPQRPFATLPELQPANPMRIKEDGVLLRAFIGESDRHGGIPLYEAIVEKVRELGLAGATVLRGVEGFGANSVVHKAGLLELSTDLPIVIEVVDTQEKIELLLPHLEQMVREGMITMEYVAVVRYRGGAGEAQSPLPHAAARWSSPVSCSEGISRRTSSMLVLPWATFTIAESRKASMPSSTACAWISAVGRLAAISSRIISLTAITSNTPVRPP